MGIDRRHSIAAVAACVLALGSAAAIAGAVTVDYEPGNVQYTQVNFNADVLVHPGPLTANVDNNPFHTPFYFADPHDVNGAPIAFLHGSHGAAAFEAWQCDPGAGDPTCQNANDAHVPMFSFSMYIEPGWGINAMDWKLDAWDNQDLGAVQFTAYDLFGNVAGVGCGGSTDTFALTSGQVEFNLLTCGGPISRLDVQVLSGGGLSDIKQVSVDVSQVPEPTGLALAATALAGLAASSRRRRPA